MFKNQSTFSSIDMHSKDLSRYTSISLFEMNASWIDLTGDSSWLNRLNLMVESAPIRNYSFFSFLITYGWIGPHCVTPYWSLDVKHHQNNKMEIMTSK